MTDTQIFEPEGRAIPYAVEGEGPVSLVLLPEDGLSSDALGVVGHYLVEEAGFHIIRIGFADDSETPAERAEDALAVLDHLDVGHTWVGGHGSGGTAARLFAAAHSDRVNGLLLLGVEESDIPLAPMLPVLIVQGAEDDVTPPAQGERLQSTAPERATVRTIDDAGHLFPLTHPIQTAFVIEEYLDWD